MALPPPSSSVFDQESKDCEDAIEAPSRFRPGSSAVKPDSAHQLLREGAGEGQPAPSAASSPLTNGFVEGCSPPEGEGEAGFADFGVFGEQAVHPWCCGLTERWDSPVGGANQPAGNSGQVGVTQSAPRSQHAPGVCPAAARLPQDDGEAQETPTTSRRAESSAAHSSERNSEQRILGNIPLSDSFADFCSAPTQVGGGGAWVHPEEQLSLSEQEEELGAARRSSTQTASRVLQLLRSSFPEVLLPAEEEEEEELLSLSAVLQAQLPPQSEDDPRAERTLLWPHHHIHSSLGLQFRWDGSHSHQILLRGLGVHSRNIVFRQSVSAAASGQRPHPPGDVPAGSPADPLQACSVQEPLDFSLQELPSSPLDWSIRGLSSSQDAASPRRAPLFWGWK